MSTSYDAAKIDADHACKMLGRGGPAVNIMKRGGCGGDGGGGGSDK